MTEPHLDDEQLSLLLDGAAEDARAHVDDGCAACGARLAALRSARDAVAAAVVPPLAGDVLDRLVAGALAAPPVADVVPLSGGRRRRLTTPPPAWLLGAAAGIAALVGVAGLVRAIDVTSGGDDARSMAATVKNERTDSAARGDELTSPAPAGGSGAVAADTAAGAATVDPELVTADLADQSDPAELALALGGSAGTTLAARQTASTYAASPSAAAAEERDAAPPGPTAPPDRAQCRSVAEAGGGGRLAELLSTSTLRWKGQPAEVLVFRLVKPSAEGSLARTAVVLSRPGCTRLAETDL